jgi:hypothetical protein
MTNVTAVPAITAVTAVNVMNIVKTTEEVLVAANVCVTDSRL